MPATWHLQYAATDPVRTWLGTPVDRLARLYPIKRRSRARPNQSLIYIRLTRKRASVPNFQEERTGSYEPPLIEISNETDRTLSLCIGNDRYSISPNSVRSISHPAGTFKFYASVPDALPRVGEKTWETGIKYPWSFYIQPR